MKKLYKIFLLILATSMFSCSDLLDIEPKQSLSSEQALKTLPDVQVALMGVYSKFTSGSYTQATGLIMADILSDNIIVTKDNTGFYSTMYDWTFNSSTSEVESYWFAAYNGLARVSRVIKRLNELELTGDDVKLKTQYLAEATAIRAYHHFNLCRYFAKKYKGNESSLAVPIVTEVLAFDALPSCDILSDVYKQIIADFKFAESTIPDNFESNVRFSKPVIQSLLAKVYLYMEDWEKVVTWSTKVIETGDYPLETSKDGIQKIYGKSNSNEIVFKIKLTKTQAAGFGDSQRLGWKFNYKNKNPYLPTEDLLSLYDKENDYRYGVIFIADADGDIAVNKFQDNPNLETSGANEVKVMRIADLYLMRAEAYANINGEKENSVKDLATLRTARLKGYSAETFNILSELKTAIKLERRKEFCFEGSRFHDLKRQGDDITMHYLNGVIKVMKADYFMTDFPYPQTEVNANPNIKQKNTGY